MEEMAHMFHITESNTAVLTNLEASSRVAETFSREVEEPTPRPGLCRNCDVQETCCYARPNTIVLYCEEYR